MNIRNTMNNIQCSLEKLNYKINDIMYDNGELQYIVFSNEDLIGQIITPKENTGGMFIIRVEIKNNFDRFSNVAYEKYYNIKDFNIEAYKPINLYRELMYVYYELAAAQV